MREILFRGKRIDNGEWTQGAYFPKNDNYPATIYTDDGLGASVDPATVGQYTGLTDKNGKKIFEGDIVVEYDFFGEIFAMGPVEWSDLFVGWKVGGKTMYGESLAIYRIIGNVHDPEIVGVSEEVQ